jgi:hypothetical protein
MDYQSKIYRFVIISFFIFCGTLPSDPPISIKLLWICPHQVPSPIPLSVIDYDKENQGCTTTSQNNDSTNIFVLVTPTWHLGLTIDNLTVSWVVGVPLSEVLMALRLSRDVSSRLLPLYSVPNVRRCFG